MNPHDRTPRIFSLADVRALARLAQEAGEIVLKIRAGQQDSSADWNLTAKQDGSPVTRADRASEAHILEGLLKLGLAAPVVAEETAPETDVTDLSGFYLIDPVDGTKAFIEGRADFSVNIGYAAGGAAAMGVLHMPASGETYYSDGAAAYRLKNGVEEKIAARAAGPALDVITNRTEDWSGRLGKYLADKNVRRLEPLSSAHKLALVAAGEFDLYPRFGSSFEWDIAAGQAIVEAAGGRVETLDGKPLAYGKKGFQNPPFIARGKTG